MIVYGKNNIVTVTQKSPAFFDKLAGNHFAYNTTQKEKILLYILGEITALYNNHLNRINKDIRQIRRAIEKISNKNIVQFVAYEDILNDFRPSLVGTDNVLKSLISGRFIRPDKKDQEKVEDIHLGNTQIIDTCIDTLATITNIREAYTTILSNSLNRVIKLFTSVTVILTIPTMIASLYGMNIKLPYSDHPYAFGGILVFTGIIILWLLYLFHRNDWF